MILSLRMINSSAVERGARKKEDRTKKKAIEKNKNKIKVGKEGGKGRWVINQTWPKFNAPIKHFPKLIKNSIR